MILNSGSWFQDVFAGQENDFVSASNPFRGCRCPRSLFTDLAGSSAKACRSFRQQAAAGLNKDLGACDDVGIAGVFAPMMADAADRGHKQHAGRHDGGENLGVMTGAAGHADGPASGKGQTRSFDRLLECGIHHGGGAGPKTLHRDVAATLRADLCGHALQQILQPLDHPGIIVTNLEQHFGASRDDARCAGIEGDAASGPYRAWSAVPRETIVNINAKPGQCQAGIPANLHPGGAGVILLAAKADLILPDADDRGDDANLEVAAFEHLALLDMRLEISDMPPALSRFSRPAGKTHLAQGVPHGLAAAAVACGIDVIIGYSADVG